MKSAALILSMFITFQSVFLSALEIPTADKYQSGYELCFETNKHLIAYEKGQFLNLPVDTKNHQKGRFQLYYWFQGEFKKDRQTLLYLNGGPGQSSHWGLRSLENLNANILLVDQRGIACSRPKDLKDYLDPSFYSSEAVAEDLAQLQNHLGLDQWSILAVSYGTIPATIFASKYPEKVKSLILEGVAYNSETLWKYQRRQDLIVNSFSKAPELSQKFIREISIDQKKKWWIVTWAKELLYRNEGVDELDRRLKTLVNAEDQKTLLEEMQASFDPEPFLYDKNEIFVLNEVPYYMLSCQELGITHYPINYHWDLQTALVGEYDLKSIQHCYKLGASFKTSIELSQYPVDVPVYYFQGENDGATEAQGALSHFAHVARNEKTLIMLKGGGHNPNLEILSFGPDSQLKLFEKAVNAEIIQEKDLELLNSELDSKILQWQIIK